MLPHVRVSRSVGRSEIGSAWLYVFLEPTQRMNNYAGYQRKQLGFESGYDMVRVLLWHTERESFKVLSQ